MLQTIKSQMFQVQSHPCSSLERSQQRHEESASLVEKRREISERIEKDKKKNHCRDTHKQCKDG